QVGAHIINKWPEDALKAVSKSPVPRGKWNHLFITYDGSGRVEGLKVYVNGVPQPTNVEANSLKNTIRTTVPFKLTQLHVIYRIYDRLIQYVRLYGRARSAAEVERLAKGTRAAWLASKPADDRTPAEKDELFSWWLAALDPAARDLNAKVNVLQQEE